MAVDHDVSACADYLQESAEQIHSSWNKQLQQDNAILINALGETQVRHKSKEVLDDFLTLLACGGDFRSEFYDNARQMLSELSRELTARHLTPSETAGFVLSLKEAILPFLQREFEGPALLSAIITTHQVLDRLGLYTFESHAASLDRVINEQRATLLSTSIPVVKVWEGIVVVAVVGRMDIARTRLMMEVLLTAIEEEQAKVVIIDVSKVPGGETGVAQHFINSVKATQLMGAECIVTGIGARISQIVVQLGIDLSGVVTRASLADGLKYALHTTGQHIS